MIVHRNLRRMVAATVAALALTTVGVLLVRRRLGLITRTYVTAAGKRLVVTLPDSSIVTLGPATTVRYAQSRRRRELTLDGLADFRVIHDGTRPFVVHIKNSQATDVGTEFIVRSYASDSSARITVLSGAVSLLPAPTTTHNAMPNLTPATTLRSGDVGVVSATNRIVVQHPTKAGLDSAWIDGTLNFDDASVQSVAIELNRWFDVDVRVDDAQLAQRHVSVTYHRPELPEVLRALGAILNVDYVQTGRVVQLRPRK